jgi:serine/threonine protein kinase
VAGGCIDYAKADLWSLGCILYFMVTKQHPHSGKDSQGAELAAADFYRRVELAAARAQPLGLPAHATEQLMVPASMGKAEIARRIMGDHRSGVTGIADRCRLEFDAVGILDSTTRSAANGRPAMVTVRYQLELARGLAEDHALREAGTTLLAGLLVHDPARRASWPEFFGCAFLRGDGGVRNAGPVAGVTDTAPFVAVDESPLSASWIDVAGEVDERELGLEPELEAPPGPTRP